MSYTAVKPRPKCEPYYDVTVGGSDEEGPDGDLRVDHDDSDDDSEGGSSSGRGSSEGDEEGDVDMWAGAEEGTGPGSRTTSGKGGKGGGKSDGGGGGGGGKKGGGGGKSR